MKVKQTKKKSKLDKTPKKGYVRDEEKEGKNTLFIICLSMLNDYGNEVNISSILRLAALLLNK